MDIPVAAWEYDENNTCIVTDQRYDYGDLRRYGAVFNASIDDSAVWQKVFDVCGLNAKPIFISNLPVLINNPIILKSRDTHTYIVRSLQTKPTGDVINVFADYLFTGESYAGGEYTEVTIDLDSVVISCTTTKNVTVFKALKLYNSVLNRNKFYSPYVFLEGSLRANTRMFNNRIQGFSRAFIISSSTFPTYTFDAMQTGYVAANYDNAYLAGKLVYDDKSSSYTTQISDSYIIDSNYISGAQHNTVLASVFEIDSIDYDNFIDGNWFEFCEYLVKPYLKLNTAARSLYIYGGRFTANVFQYFYRLFEENTFFSSWFFDNCIFTSFGKTKLQSIFTNVTSAKFLTKKCGILVMDRLDNDNGTLEKMIFNNARIASSDYGFYIDVGTGSRRHSIKEINTFIYDGSDPTTYPVFIRMQSSATFSGTFLDSYFSLLQDRSLDTLPTISDAPNVYLNVFNGQRLYVGGVPYVACLNSSKLPAFVSCFT